MAKAQFHKNQRVYVKPVGTWALIERVVPHWVKGIEEPIRIHYDVGLGREFAAEELRCEEASHDGKSPVHSQSWRVVRARNKWQPTEDCAKHPVPGTYPVVMTSDTDWGGWRVPGAEYELNPASLGPLAINRACCSMRPGSRSYSAPGTRQPPQSASPVMTTG